MERIYKEMQEFEDNIDDVLSDPMLSKDVELMRVVRDVCIPNYEKIKRALNSGLFDFSEEDFDECKLRCYKNIHPDEFRFCECVADEVLDYYSGYNIDDCIVADVIKTEAHGIGANYYDSYRKCDLCIKIVKLMLKARS